MNTPSLRIFRNFPSTALRILKTTSYVPHHHGQRTSVRRRKSHRVQIVPVRSHTALHPSLTEPEIWRRRSGKSDLPVPISLKLTANNGSTASPHHNLPPTESLPPLASLPRSNGPKDRSIRKPVSPPGLQHQPGFMGTEHSKIRERLPTSGYRGRDKKGDSGTTASKPEPPPKDVKKGFPLISKGSKTPTPSPSLQTISLHSEETRTTTAPSLASLSTKSREIYSIPTTTPLSSRPPSESTTITSPKQYTRPLSNSYPRTQTPRPFSTIGAGISPAEAARTIIPGSELDVVHYDCYQNHRNMRYTRNKRCPLACMVCKKQDAEKRWSCAWCCLRCCDGCMQELTQAPRRDLRALVARVHRAGPVRTLEGRG